MTRYYIDPETTSTTQDGGLLTPYATLSDLPSLSPGDTVYLKKGTVLRESYNLIDSGSAYQPICFKSYGSGSTKPIVSASDPCHGFIGYGSELLTNGNCESWSGANDLDNWTETTAGSNVITQETSDPYLLTKSVKLTVADADDLTLSQASISFSGLSELRVSLASKQSAGAGGISIAIKRTGGGTDDYWDNDAGAWTTSETYNEIDYSLFWDRWFMDLDVTSNPESHTSIGVFIKFDCSNTGDEYWIDAISFGKIGLTTTNLIQNPSFENWTGSLPDNYSVIDDGQSGVQNGVVRRTTNKRYGTYGLEYQVDSEQNQISINQTISGLSATDFRLSAHFHCFQELSIQDGSIRVQVIEDQGLGVYRSHNGTTWINGQTAAALSGNNQEYTHDHADISFSAYDSSYTYSLKITHAITGDKIPVQYERMFIDFISLIEDDQSTEVYQAYFPEEPSMVYVTGTVNGETVDHLQLFLDDSNHPHLNGYYYDDTNKILYVNVGEDMAACSIECSVRNTTFDLFNNAGGVKAGSSYIEIKGIGFYRSIQNGFDGGYAEAYGDRPTHIKLSNCDVKYAGWMGILFGYREPHPDPSDPEPDIGSYYTSGNITVEDCTVYRWGRARLVRSVYTVSGEVTAWCNGYPSHDAGIRIAPGEMDSNDDPADAGTHYIRRNLVQSDIPLINYSTERNGIWIATGYKAYIYENEVTQTDHGLYTASAYCAQGHLEYFEIYNNFVHDTGDDSCWIYGNSLNGNKVCYNIFANAGDNMIDLNLSILPEIYNNTFHGESCDNECIVIWGDTPVNGNGAFIYNNIFHLWGGTWRTSQPGLKRGCAIGFFAGNSTGESTYDHDATVIDNNIYYQTSGADTEDYPFYIASNNGDGTVTYQRLSFSEWQALGFDENGTNEDPKLIDPDNDNFALKRTSPAFNTGKDLSKCKDIITISGTDVTFDFANVKELLIKPTSTTWPDSVVTIAQGDSWHKGCWTWELPTLTKASGADDFPTDFSLNGCPVIAVDATNYRAWYGRIVSNTSSVLTLDGWEPLFNAEDTPPYGSLTYYIGYIFLYDRTPEFSFFNDHKCKGLNKIEIGTNRLSSSVPCLYRLNIDDEGLSNTNLKSFDENRMQFIEFGGLHKVFQFEHGAVVDQKMDVKLYTFFASWLHGEYTQT